MVWVAAGASAVFLLLDRPPAATHVAWMPTTIAGVTSPEDGRLASLTVTPGQYVRRGEVLGRLDGAALLARLSTEEARVSELRARVDSAETKAEADLARFAQELEVARGDEARRYAADLRRYRGDETELALDLLDHQVRRARTALELEHLRVRLARAQGLVDDGVGPAVDVEDLTLRMRRSEAELERLDALLARTATERDAASARLAAFVADAPPEVVALAPPDTLAGVRAAVLVQERTVDEVQVSLANLELTTPIDGVVHEILLLEGQSVSAADVVVRVLSPRGDEAVLFIDPIAAHETLVGRAVELRGASPDGPVVESTITAVSPHVELMPERLWLGPDLPRYGRAARVPLGAPGVFLPGEVLGARLD